MTAIEMSFVALVGTKGLEMLFSSIAGAAVSALRLVSAQLRSSGWASVVDM